MPALNLVMEEALRILKILDCPATQSDSMVHGRVVDVREFDECEDGLSHTMDINRENAVRIVFRN